MAATPRPSVFADPAALMRVRDLELRARAVVEGFWKGLHRSARHGYSTEFAEYRSYVPGDDIRYLDWKVLARRDRYFIRKYREETNLRSHVLLDLSRSMNYGSSSYTKLDYARTLAATLAVFLHQQGDETGLVTFDEGVRDYLPPRHRSGHLHAILAALGREALGKVAALKAPIATILGRGRARGVILLISDFLTPLEDLRTPLSALAACGHDITLFQTLDPTEIHFTFGESADFEDMESGRSQMTDPASIRDGYLKKFNAHQDGLKQLCSTLGIIHHLLPIDQPLETALHAYLSDRQGLGPQVQRTRGN
ncbi:MAG: DUF58 domain-containing protein [Akkermansiaceae bacterium]|nr:DUF58 domain-containing protein [Akkermansiaceae bacterium]